MRSWLIVAAISIHAPREGCDAAVAPGTQEVITFQSTHPARGATRKVVEPYSPQAFQSTHPARGATSFPTARKSFVLYFNPRTPRGVRQVSNISFLLFHSTFQSTHPARGATDTLISVKLTDTFQSTHPARGATLGFQGVSVCRVISIHAPREGCDSKLY